MIRQASVARLASLALVATLLVGPASAQPFTEGEAELRSAGVMAFGPGGVLFVADPKAAAIFAIDTDDTAARAKGEKIHVESLATKIAALLGTKAAGILINDLAVHPISKSAYISVSRGRGPDASPALVRIAPGGEIRLVSLKKVRFARAELPDPPRDAVLKRGRRSMNPRMQSITDIAYSDGSVLVAGLSNEEFASSLRSIPFPFKDVGSGLKVEIFHGAHGGYETHAPVRTFIPLDIGGEPHLLAAYTCTPLVKLPIASLNDGESVSGTTIAELGNHNRPLDMIAYRKDGKDYILIANDRRGVMKLETTGFDSAEGITSRVKRNGTEGIAYETIPSWQGIEQLDQFDAETALVIQRDENKSRQLTTRPLP